MSGASRAGVEPPAAPPPGRSWGPGPAWSPGAAPGWGAWRPTNTKAILAVALLSVPPAALVFALLARDEIKRTGEAGWGLATAGLWISVCYLGLLAVGLLAYVALFAAIFGISAAHGAALVP